ncbi:MAG: hypothetical protein JSV17_09440 [Candidatus Aminicenantes bacterium]|nr:MAG: hypothetical protein JSV17_09440 [Candidatus Aminicenantes bacterium]
MGETSNINSEKIKIDYENVDVEDIMDQVRKRIASQPRSPEPESPVQPAHASSLAPSPPQPESPLSKKAKIKKVMLKLFKPISPLIKFLILPVHQELKDTIQNLYATNQRIGLLERNVDENFAHVRQKLEEVDQATIRRLEELNRVREYTQLIHNLSHNIVVELTKLKIEQENLKLKTRIMEKDFEFLGKREKTLESKIFG